MGTRIIVRCKSQPVPGQRELRSQTIANLVCQHVWHRDFGNIQDGVQSRGQFDRDGDRCYFLVDVGPPDSENNKISMYNWDGSCLCVIHAFNTLYCKSLELFDLSLIIF